MRLVGLQPVVEHFADAADHRLGARHDRAAARAQVRTGLTLTTHAARWPVGLAQVELLREERVDPARIIVGHCDTVTAPGYHDALARTGVYVQMDTIRGQSEYDTQRRVELVMALEEEFDVTVDESELEGIETVGQAFELVTSKQ